MLPLGKNGKSNLDIKFPECQCPKISLQSEETNQPTFGGGKGGEEGKGNLQIVYLEGKSIIISWSACHAAGVPDVGYVRSKRESEVNYRDLDIKFCTMHAHKTLQMDTLILPR